MTETDIVQHEQNVEENTSTVVENQEVSKESTNSKQQQEEVKQKEYSSAELTQIMNAVYSEVLSNQKEIKELKGKSNTAVTRPVTQSNKNRYITEKDLDAVKHQIEKDNSENDFNQTVSSSPDFNNKVAEATNLITNSRSISSKSKKKIGKLLSENPELLTAMYTIHTNTPNLQKNNKINQTLNSFSQKPLRAGASRPQSSNEDEGVDMSNLLSNLDNKDCNLVEDGISKKMLRVNSSGNLVANCQNGSRIMSKILKKI